MALKFKRPMDFILSALRQLETESDGGPALHGYLGEMGQPLYEWPTPDGPPDHADSWGNLLPRWKFALALAQGEIKGTKIDYPELLAGLPQEPGGAQTLLQAISQRLDLSLPDETLQSLAALLDGETLSGEPELPAMVAAGLVASPAFQWR